MPIPPNLDEDKLCEMALAMLALTAHGSPGGTRAWKGMDWELLHLLYQRGWIGNPAGKAKSVEFTETGERLAEALLARHFGLPGTATRKAPVRRAKKPASSDTGPVHQFRVTLLGTTPPVWRRIQVPGSYTFWDLHVAIQDAMGWQDYHLHEFRLAAPLGEQLRIGIPDPDFPEIDGLPGWEVPLSAYISPGAPPAMYLYDFGDDWEHELVYEGLVARETGARYPRCVDGARACPPEDCGGVGGYEELVRGMHNPKHRRHKELREWIGGSFDPDAFDPAAVVFDDPRKRWKRAFGG